MTREQVLTRRFTSTRNAQLGFSMIEMFIVLLVIAIIVVLALPQFMSSRRLLKFSGTQNLMITAFREARQDAITQRANIKVKYNDSNKTITVSGGTYGAPGTSNNKVISLAGDGVAADEIIYGRPTGASAASLGDGTNLSALISNVAEITFRADGSSVDASNNPQSHALFFYNSKDPDNTGFAVSVLGTGGRIKLWRFNRGINAYVE